MNYTSIKKELLIALRGDLSQKEISQMLGYKFNQYHKWEADLKWLRWNEFIDILMLTCPQYKVAFTNILTFYEDPKDLNLLFSTLCADLTVKEIGYYVGHNESVVRKWIKNDISPSVETIFKLINDRTNNFLEFVSQLIDINKIPDLKKMYFELEQQKLVEAELPFSNAIKACLQLEEYKNLSNHSDCWVSDRILVSEYLVKKTIDALSKVGTLSKVENKYHVNNSWIEVSGLSAEQIAKFCYYWTNRCLDCYKGPTGVPYRSDYDSSFRHFRIAPVSNQAAKDIQTLLRKTSQQILKIMKNDKDKKNKIAVCVNHFFEIKDIRWIKTEE